MVRKSHWVNKDDLFEFLFPSNMQHPRSTGRLIVFGEYGPFAEDGTLRAGWRARHRITDRELKTMIDEIEREDLIAIFVVRLCSTCFYLAWILTGALPCAARSRKTAGSQKRRSKRYCKGLMNRKTSSPT